MIPEDVKSSEDLPALFADPEGYATALKDFVGMFDREIYDVIVFCGTYSGPIAGSVASKMNKCILNASEVSAETLKGKEKAILVCDELKSGESQLKLIQKMESLGCKVIRAGFVIERTACGARKSKILKKYPFEALITI